MKPDELTGQLTALRGRLAPPETGDPVTGLAMILAALVDYILTPPPAPAVGADPVKPTVL